MALPSTVQRVPLHTAAAVNRRIRWNTLHSINYYRQHPDEIEQRLQALDREWDIERALEANAGGAMLTGTLLGLTLNRAFLLLPLAVGGFLLQHALQGWCPPLPLFRRLGYRTAAEIQEERDGLERIRQSLH